MGTRESFRTAKPRQRTTFPYHGDSYVGIEPTAAEIREWQNSYRSADGQIDMQRVLLSDEALLCIVLKDDHGQPLATFDEVYAGLFDDHPCRELNSLTTQVSAFCALDATERRQLRDAVKNLRTVPSSESSSSSPPAADSARAK